MQVRTRSLSDDLSVTASGSEAFATAAGEIASVVRRDAAIAPDGGVSWSVASRNGNGLERWPLGPHLGSGVLGVAVFFATLDRVRGGREHHEICLGTVARLRRDLQRHLERQSSASRSHAPGGMCGLGSVAYGLAILGELLGEPALLLDALSVCRLLDPAELRREDRLDVMFGLAGLLLALLALERSLERSSTAGAAAGGLPLELAAVCAERLIAYGRSGPHAGALATPGYSHGAAGVAHALSAFARRTGDRTAREAAGALLAGAERELAAMPTRRGSWCNGLAGLAIARLAAADGDPASGISADLLDELETAPAAHDHLCCGWSGRVDVLLHVARELGAPERQAAARRIGAGLLERHRNRALSFPHPEIRFEPRLLRGPVGVGYAFLRLCDSASPPCLLAFE